MSSALRRAEGGLSVNRPLAALPAGPAAIHGASTAPPPPPPKEMMMQTASKSISYSRPLDSGPASPVFSNGAMSQMAPRSMAFNRPLAATGEPNVPLAQPAAPSISYTRPLDASHLTNVAASAGRTFQRPIQAVQEPAAIDTVSNIILPARSYQKPLDSAPVQPSEDDYWTNLSKLAVKNAEIPAPEPYVQSVSDAPNLLYGSSYMPQKALLAPEQIEIELRNLKELLDSGFLQGFEFEARKAALIKQKKFAFSFDVPQVSFGELSANVILDSMDDAPHSKRANRNVRVFISSTFRDMGDEREVILKQIFPHVQKACRERGVYVTPVDLRWGITSDQTSSAETIRVCLSEIDRCRPYFITLLGGRYGWTQPANGSDELLKRTHDRAAQSFPWIRKFSNRSVTELEIRHALMNDIGSATSRRGLVYLRKDVADDDVRLTALKKELTDLRSQGAFQALETYASAEELKVTLTRDLMSLIDADFPISEIPSALERERQFHEAFEDSRTRLYISRPSLFSQLNSHLLNPTSGPAVVVGEAGVGKSSFLCNWAVRYRRDNPDQLVISHYIGASSDSTILGRTLTRIMQEIKSFYSLEVELSTTITGLIEQFPTFLAEAGKRRGLILILDALDQLDAADNAHDLLWLPAECPHGVRLIVSVQGGKCSEIINQRKWKQTSVAPLAIEEREQLVASAMVQAGKKLTPEQSKLITASPQCASPLFLRTLLEELRVFGSFEELEGRIRGYLAASTTPDLFQKVFERLEADFNGSVAAQKRAEVEQNFVGCILGAIFCTRKGITEAELLDALQVTQAEWSPLNLALEEMVVARAGFLTFFHDYMRKAVLKRYGDHLIPALRKRLLRYFSDRAANDLAGIQNSKDSLSLFAQRAIEEVPSLMVHLGMKQELSAFVSTKGCFLALSSPQNRYDLVRYVRECKCEHSIRYQMIGSSRVSDLETTAAFFKEIGSYDIAEEFYNKALLLAQGHSPVDQLLVSEQLDGLGYVQRLRGKYVDAASTLEKCLAIKRKILKSSDPSLATSTNSLAIIYRKQGKYEQAEKLYNQALEMRLSIFGPTHADVAQSYNSLGCLHQDMGRFPEAEKNLLEAIRQRELLLGSSHPDVAMSLFNLGNVYLDWSRYQEAVPIYERSLQIYESVFGPSHPYVAQVLNSMAGVQQEMGHYDDAEKIYHRTLEMREKLLGPAHPDVALTVNDIAVLYSRQEKFHEAVVYYQRALEIRLAVVGDKHPDYAQALKNMATVYQDMGRFADALPLFEQTLSVYKTALGENHPNVASAYTGLAGLKQQLGQYDSCVPLYEKACEIYSSLAGGTPDSDLALTLNDFAVLYFRMKNWAKSEELYLAALDMYERCFGLEHPDVAQALVNIGHFHTSRGDPTKAREYFARAGEIYSKLFGSGHSKTIHALGLASS